MRSTRVTKLFACCLLAASFASHLSAQDEEQEFSPRLEEAPADQPTFDPPKGAVKLTKDYDAWADFKSGTVIVDGYVCLDRGQLEMFACPKGTKEHEAIVAVRCPARFIHAGLLAVKIPQGTAVQYSPKYIGASGPVIDVTVHWHDKDGKVQKARAQDWIRSIRTKKEMTEEWVFAGSGFYFDENTKTRHYLADDGDLVCVSNFSTATLDLPVKSSADTQGLLFEAFTDKIPPRKTNVRVTFKAQRDKDGNFVMRGKKAPADSAKKTPEKQTAATPKKDNAAKQNANAGTITN